MNKFALWVPVIALLYLFSSCHHQAKFELSGHDIKFIKKAREAGLTEVKAAQIAVSRSQNPRIVALAKMLLSTYNGTLSKLRELKAPGLENNIDSISPAHQQYLANISKLSSSEFDKAYMNGELNNSTGVLMVYVDGMQGREDSLFSYASSMVPTLQDQVDSVKKITASIR
ncbi:MAG: DUF4142 domain-containing protein [Bacteroidetes bacterium]|nr:DUF4142 domain-containing protein [Bacteroidota bacterium]